MKRITAWPSSFPLMCVTFSVFWLRHWWWWCSSELCKFLCCCYSQKNYERLWSVQMVTRKKVTGKILMVIKITGKKSHRKWVKITRCENYHFLSETEVYCGSETQLTHLSLVSLLWDIGKQWRPRADAAERAVWSGSPLFAYRMFYYNLNNDEKYLPTPLKFEIDSSYR